MDGEQSARAIQGQSSDDWDLIRLVGTGDQGALERLYKQYYRCLYRFILQITRRGDLVLAPLHDAAKLAVSARRRHPRFGTTPPCKVVCGAWLKDCATFPAEA